MPEAPAAPTPAPSPNATPPKAPETQKPSPEPRKEASHDAPEESNIFDELDAKLNPPEPKKEAPKKKEAKEAKEDTSEDEPEEKPFEEKAEDDDKAESKDQDPKDKEGRKFQLPKFAREQIEKTNAELKSIKQKMEERERQVAEFEKRAKESTSLTERIAQIEKERDTALAEARAAKQEVSPDFKEKWEKPFERAAAEAKRFIEQLPMTEADGTVRKATWDRDFAALFAMPEVEAVEKAEVLFGKHAPRVMARYDELHRLSNQIAEARNSERENWKKTEAERVANQAKQREASMAALATAEKYYKTKHAAWYDEDPTDPEGNEMMKQMAAKMQEPPKTMSEWAAKEARARLNTIAFPRVVHRLNKAMNEIKELKTKLSELAESEPGKTKRTGSETKSDDGDWDSELQKLRKIR